MLQFEYADIKALTANLANTQYVNKSFVKVPNLFQMIWLHDKVEQIQQEIEVTL